MRRGRQIHSLTWMVLRSRIDDCFKFRVWYGYDYPTSSSIIWVLLGNTLVGLLETTLIAHCKSIQGVDISQGMVDQYNKRAGTLGVTSKMSAVAYELKDLPEELEGRKFDVVLVRTSAWAPKPSLRTDMHLQCTMAYHHFESTDEITRIPAYG